MLIDTHCHLTYPPLSDNLTLVLQRAAEAGVGPIITIGTDIDSSQQCVSLAEKHPQIFAAVGIHPNDASHAPATWQKLLRELIKHPKVVALGEVGLDYYWKTTPQEQQIDFLKRQIEIAETYAKPLILHNRQADNDLLTVVDEMKYYRGVLHCFASTAEFAHQMLERGMYISFTGSITYGSRRTQSALLSVSDERLMLETDAPFLTPASLKPRPNEPAFLPIIAEHIANLRGIEPETLAALTSQNAIQFFNLPI